MTLTWTAAGATSYDVLFGPSDPPSQVASGLTHAVIHRRQTLSRERPYFWQIVAHNSGGVNQGPEWTFTVVGSPAAARCADLTESDGRSNRYHHQPDADVDGRGRDELRRPIRHKQPAAASRDGFDERHLHSFRPDRQHYLFLANRGAERERYNRRTCLVIYDGFGTTTQQQHRDLRKRRCSDRPAWELDAGERHDVAQRNQACDRRQRICVDQ